MELYRITYTRDDMKKDYVASILKWGRDEKDVLKHMLKKRPEKSGLCIFKKGGTGKILSIEKQ